MKKLVYICPVCKKKFGAHIHGNTYERKILYCVSDGAMMNCALEGVEDATIKTKRT